MPQIDYKHTMCQEFTCKLVVILKK